MSQEKCPVSPMPETHDRIDCDARVVFQQVLKMLRSGVDTQSCTLECQALLRKAGLSQNTRNRIVHLNVEEIQVISKSIPADPSFWHFYVSELQVLLSKIEQSKKVDESGRPYITKELMGTVGKLTIFQYLLAASELSLPPWMMKKLLLQDYDVHLTTFAVMDSRKQGHHYPQKPILTLAAIGLLKLYLDELLMPPCIEIWQTYDVHTLHDIETADFSWMDDGGISVLANIKEVPLTTYVDRMPDFISVLDWFISINPVMDKNQMKLGWSGLESKCIDWRENDSYQCYARRYLNFSAWRCVVAAEIDEWNAAIPSDNPLRLIPLNSPRKLLDESLKMHNCAIYYAGKCINGESRMFSIRDSVDGQCVATAELSSQGGTWALVQLKGQHNQELIQKIGFSNPLQSLLIMPLNWYNTNSWIEKSDKQQHRRQVNYRGN